MLKKKLLVQFNVNRKGFRSVLSKKIYEEMEKKDICRYRGCDSIYIYAYKMGKENVERVRK